MITRVIGKANGFDIVFTHMEGARWETTVPSNFSGEYVVEIYAEHDSGNSAYVCKMLFVICGHELQAYILDNGYLGDVQTNPLTGQVSIGEFLANVLENGITASPDKAEYTVIPRERGYTIEQAVCSRDAY